MIKSTLNNYLRKRGLLIVFSLFTLSCTNTDSKSGEDNAQKELLMETVKTFNTAFNEGNIEVLIPMITNYYVHTNSNSKSIGKEDWLAYLAKRKKQLESGELVIKNYEMDEIDVKMYENMAILTGKISFLSISGGMEKQNAYRVTNVWVLEDGRWKRAGFHDTRID